MQFNLYCIYDTVAKQASAPFIAKSDEVALRQLRRVVQSEQGDISEYWLYHLGQYDPEECVVVALEHSERVLEAVRA